MEQPSKGRTRNKVRTYLLYAIGEILLVMVGILLALQVNNWNNANIEKAEERQLLINLREDFEQATIQLNYLNEIRRNVISAVDDVVLISNSDGPYENDTLDSLFAALSYSPTFNDPTGSLASILSTNKINLISNNELKVALLSWPRESEDMTEDEIRHVRFYDDQYRNFTLRYASTADILSNYKISDVEYNMSQANELKFTQSKHVESDYRSLLSSQMFINILHTRSIFMDISLTESIILIEHAENIIEIINSELGS